MEVWVDLCVMMCVIEILRWKFNAIIFFIIFICTFLYVLYKFPQNFCI